MAPKTCDGDPLPLSLFKDLAPHIIDIIMELVNTSLSEGIFVNNWKTAIINPLLTKLVEECMLAQFNKHCSSQNLMPSYQSAYSANHSCKTSLLRLCNDILWAMEKQDIMALVALDLSAAFDMVHHSVLLNVLHNQF